MVESIRQSEYVLADLIEKITDANRHEEIDFGAPAGEEPFSGIQTGHTSGPLQ